MTSKSGAPIDPAWTINELLVRHPESLPVLQKMGVDLCCGGPRTITAAAKAAGMDSQALLRALQTAASEPPATSSVGD